MRHIRFVVMLAAALSVSAAAGAHEGHSHAAKLMGTVKAVHEDTSRVEITTTGGKTTAFYVSPATKYLKGTAAAALADLKVGARVVVETKVEGDKTVATTVKLGGAPAVPPVKQ